MAETSYFQCSVKLRVQLFERLLGACDLMLGSVYPAGDPVHLALEDVEWNSSGVVSFHERGLFVFQRSVSAACFIESEARIGLAVRQLFADDSADRFDTFGCETKLTVEVLYAILYRLNADVLSRARRGLGSPSETEKVVVLGT